MRRTLLPPRVPTIGVPILAVGLLILAACDPAASGLCASPSVTLQTTVTAETMDPPSLEACRDQDVVLEIAAETDGIFHVGGYEETTALTAGETTTLAFNADAAGQFLIHFHDQQSGVESEIGVLTVHEP